MPSVGMRRTTRVFGVSKTTDGARVLRSGRRLWPESGEIKLRGPNDVDDWYRLINGDENGGGRGREDVDCRWGHEKLSSKQNSFTDLQEEDIDREMKMGRRKLVNPVAMASDRGGGAGSRTIKSDRMFGNVYSRKRKRTVAQEQNVTVQGQGGKVCSGNKMFGLRFFRRQRRKKNENVASGVVSTRVSWGRYNVFTVSSESSDKGGGTFAGFIYMVLSYMRKNRLRITRLSSFLLSDPINGAFASHGIRFVQGRSSIENTGICMFFSAMQFTPMFFVEFSAIPLCFMHMHSTMYLRSMFRPAHSLNDVHSSDESMSESEDEDCILESIVPHSYARDASISKIISAEVVQTAKKPVLRSSSRRTKLVGRNTQQRNVSSSRGVQTRSSALRNTRARNNSLAGLHKPKKFLAPQVLSKKKIAPSFSPVAFYNRHKRSGRLSSASTALGTSQHSREASSTILGPTQSLALPSCSANLLVFESDKCYRKEGAVVKLEFSESGEWLLVVKIGDLATHTIKAEKVMRPCSCNRFTHHVMWSADDTWKLEFPNRQDWFIFKDLYKACYDRNVLNAEPIPVPGIYEVSGYVDNFDHSFSRPDSYISSKNDEVSRAMAKRTANYDMDTDDEGWLDQLNVGSLAQNELHESVSEDKFELMIDAFEKGFYCSVDDALDEKAAVALCSDLGGREVLEAVYNYWTKKRKQKKAPLLRVFQGHQPKKHPLIPKPPPRKRRSVKRQPSQVGRGKQSSLWRAIAAERHAMELQNAKLKAEEARNAATKSTELAVVKREKAQKLFENADLLAYKATMAVRIAQAAQVAESTNSAASQFLLCDDNLGS